MRAWGPFSFLRNFSLGRGGRVGSHVGNVSGLQLSEAVRAERSRCAEIARRHLGMVAHHHPDCESQDLVSQGYGNAALNILHEISGPGFTRVGP